MNEAIARLGADIAISYQRFTVAEPAQRFIVTIAGPPGCGKSTVVDAVIDAVVTSGAVQGEEIVSVGLDGWHYSLAELSAQPNATELLARRGASFTFDLDKYTRFLNSVTLPLSSKAGQMPIYFPTFDHALKDPSTSLYPITPQHRIIIIEGLYTQYDQPSWRECADRADIKVWIDVDRQVSRARLVARNVAAGIFPSVEAAEVLVEANDMVNDRDVRLHRVPPTHIIRSE